ncbi:hypothetical protein GIB67_037624, partial [Kingdonia uniflora]
ERRAPLHWAVDRGHFDMVDLLLCKDADVNAKTTRVVLSVCQNTRNYVLPVSVGIQQVTDTFQQFILNLGEEEATNIISKLVFYLSIGSNDYIHYYLLNVSRVQSLYLPWTFNQLLATTIKQELKNLYNANVRKVIVMGLAPIGCTPHYLWQYQSKNG